MIFWASKLYLLARNSIFFKKKKIICIHLYTCVYIIKIRVVSCCCNSLAWRCALTRVGTFWTSRKCRIEFFTDRKIFHRKQAESERETSPYAYCECYRRIRLKISWQFRTMESADAIPYLPFALNWICIRAYELNKCSTSKRGHGELHIIYCMYVDTYVYQFNSVV